MGRNERAGRGAQGPHHSAEKPQKCSTRGCPVTVTTTPHPCRSGTAALSYEHRAELLLSAAGETAGTGQRVVPQRCTFQGQQTPSAMRRAPDSAQDPNPAASLLRTVTNRTTGAHTPPGELRSWAAGTQKPHATGRQGNNRQVANPNPRIRGKERALSTHGSKERDAGAEAYSSRNDAELASLVRNGGGRQRAQG